MISQSIMVACQAAGRSMWQRGVNEYANAYNPLTFGSKLKKWSWKPCGSCLSMISFGDFGAPQFGNVHDFGPVLRKLENINDSNVRSWSCSKQCAEPLSLEEMLICLHSGKSGVETILKW